LVEASEGVELCGIIVALQGILNGGGRVKGCRFEGVFLDEIALGWWRLSGRWRRLAPCNAVPASARLAIGGSFGENRAGGGAGGTGGGSVHGHFAVGRQVGWQQAQATEACPPSLGPAPGML